MLMNTCVICRNIENVNFGMVIFHLLSKLLVDVNTLTINELDHLLHCWKAQ